MARVLLVATPLPQPFATVGALVGVAAQTFDATNLNYFVSTGREVLFIYNNSGNGAATITVYAQPDAEGRSNNISSSVADTGGLAISQMFPVFGWSSGGYINVDCSVAGVNYALFQVVLSRWPAI